MVTFAPLTRTQMQKIVVERKRAEPSIFMDRFFKEVVRSKTNLIVIDDLPEGGRRLAPRVSPLVAGKPISKVGSEARAVRPTYLKLNTPVDGNRNQISGGNDILSAMLSGDPAQEHARERARVIVEHTQRIYRTWEYMGSFAAINGFVDTEFEGAPLARVDFGRDPSLTVVKTAGTYWGEDGVSILDDVQDWKRLMNNAVNGGRAAVMMVGSKVASVMVKAARKDGELHELLDTRYGAESSFLRGLRGDEPVNYLGRMSGMIDVYEYDAQYETLDNDGNIVTKRPLAENEIAMFAADIGGVAAFAKIEDLAANHEPLPIFGRNFIVTGDPDREVITHQSAPIMIPTMPNCTFKATVMAAG